MQKRVMGVIDVGSNSLRLMVAQADGPRFEVLHTSRVTTRMISGLENGYLNDGTIEQNAQAVCQLAGEAKAHGADSVYAFGTSAMRDALNRETLNDRVQQLCSLRISVMSGEEEAQLAYGGCAPEGRCGVMDIGGGSTEVLCGQDGQVGFAVSARMGAVRLMNALQGDSSDPDVMIAAAREVISPVFSGVREQTVDRWMGVGGTITTLAAMTWRVSKYSPHAIENCPLEKEAVRRWLSHLTGMTVEERKQIIGLPPHRADVIPFGVAILCAVMDETGAQAVYATDHDNLEGYIRQRLLKESGIKK